MYTYHIFAYMYVSRIYTTNICIKLYIMLIYIIYIFKCTVSVSPYFFILVLNCHPIEHIVDSDLQNHQFGFGRIPCLPNSLVVNTSWNFWSCFCTNSRILN